MALSFYFRPQSMSSKQYDDITRRLEEAGLGNPKGRLYHSCFGTKNRLHVHDIWDTQENFNEFGKALVPLFQEFNLDPGEPEVQEVHNIIEHTEILTKQY